MVREETYNSYFQSINRALDYINAHYTEELTLELISQKACFSPFHFHRIFKSLVGETIQEYLNRIRLEKAIHLMDEGASLTHIALEVGFSSLSHFSQSFKTRYGVSPKAYRTDLRKIKHTKLAPPKNTRGSEFKSRASIPVHIQNYPNYTIAYVRHIGNYDIKIGFAWGILMTWARQRRLLTNNSFRISISWDEPGLTPHGRLRYDACLIVPPGTKGEGKVSVRTLEGGPYAVFPYEGRVENLGDFYNAVYGCLLSDSRLKLRDIPAYRVHHENITDHIFGQCRQELRVPIESNYVANPK